MLGEISRAKRIGSVFEEKKKRVFWRFRQAGFPKEFINAKLKNSKYSDVDLYSIPKWFFDIKPRYNIRIPYCRKNETIIGSIINKIEYYTNGNIKLLYSWNTNKLRTLSIEGQNLPPIPRYL